MRGRPGATGLHPAPVRRLYGELLLHAAGATYRTGPWRSRSCVANADDLPNSDTRCDILIRESDQGDPSLCCDGDVSGARQRVGGVCCRPSGQHCSSYDLCCNGEGCPESGRRP